MHTYAAPIPDTSRRIPASLIEGLFIRALPASAAFSEALRAVGIDVAHLAADYPVEVWRAGMAVARRLHYPHLSEEAAYRQLGRDFAQGFLEAVEGAGVGQSFPTLGRERIADRIPRHVAMVRKDIHVAVQVVGESERVITFRDPDPLPDFMAGCIEAGIAQSHVSSHVRVEERGATGYTLRVRW